MKRVKVGVVGCGNISAQYLRHGKNFEILDFVALADLDMARAEARAQEFGIPTVLTVEQMLQDAEIEIIVNLTIPAAHAEVSKQILNHGKHVYVEKPLTIELAEGQQVMELAAKKGLWVGCAPDTVLGGGMQTCRHLIDQGKIGVPLSATAFMLGSGHESWHPDPAFYYKQGGGPLFDMGPYYIAALIQLFGPVSSINAMAKSAFAERTITSEPKKGEKITVDVPTHLSGNLSFHNGAIATMIMSFDVFGSHSLPYIEVYGTEGTIRVPDPNTFKGPVMLSTKQSKEWQEVELTHPYADRGRSLGVADMAYAIRTGRTPRASGELGYHALEVMHGFHIAAVGQTTYVMKSHCERPSAMPIDGLTE